MIDGTGPSENRITLIGPHRSEIYDVVQNTDVFDTHTHLDSSENVAARNPWDILHYFWFKRELCAAGYPVDAEALDERTRRARFLESFEKSRNTSWNTVARRILADLYDVSLESPGDFDELEEKLATTATDPEWPVSVCDKLSVRNIVVDEAEMHISDSLRERLVIVPNYGLTARIRDDGADNVDVESDIDRMVGQGYRSIRVDLDPFLDGRQLPANEEAVWQRMLARLNDSGIRIQVFSGMKRDRKPHTMLDDPQRIIRLYPVFDQYSAINFEIVNAAAGNNLDIVQAARVFPNVHPGGLWWFNFRASSYRSVFQQRFEALPTGRSCIVASDARCIEWLYGKVLLVKSLLAQFLEDQIDNGWTDLAGASHAAGDWLYATGKAGYTSGAWRRGS